MAEDQSVVGRRQIYYDQHGGETLICSDSEEDPEPEEEKREYSEGEDCVIWLVKQRGRVNYGPSYVLMGKNCYVGILILIFKEGKRYMGGTY